MEKFLNKFRIPSARLQTWNYGWSGFYFITICTKNRKHYFGEISNSQMTLSDVGKQAEIEWNKTPEIRVDMHVQLGEFIVMPNHFHGIIMIGDNEFNDDDGGDAMHHVSTCTTNSIDQNNPYKNQFGAQSKNLHL